MSKKIKEMPNWILKMMERYCSKRAYTIYGSRRILSEQFTVVFTHEYNRPNRKKTEIICSAKTENKAWRKAHKLRPYHGIDFKKNVERMKIQHGAKCPVTQLVDFGELQDLPF